MVQFFDPTQEAEIKRRRRMAEALQAQAAPRDTQVVSGYAVPQSGLEQLAKGLAGGLGAYQGGLADQKEQDLTVSRQKLLAEALAKIDTDQKGAGAMLAQDPSMMAAGLGLITDANKTDRAQILADSQFQQKQQLADEAAKNARINAGIKAGGLTTDADGNIIEAPGGPRPGKAPSGYEYDQNGEMVFIPGGPADPNVKPLTEAQANSGMYADRMVMSEPVLTDPAAMKEYNSIWEKTKDVINPFGSGLNSTEYQKYKQAKGDFTTAKLRKESGATIADSEFDRDAELYYPQPGDSPEVLAQKEENRKTIIGGMKRAAGRGYQPPVAPTQSGSDPLAAARDAIARGAPRDAVIQRLQQGGIDPTGL